MVSFNTALLPMGMARKGIPVAATKVRSSSREGGGEGGREGD